MEDSSLLHSGVNESEKALSELLCRVFLPTCVFANTTKRDGRELCDVFVRVWDRAYIFSVQDRNFNSANDVNVEWARWSRETIGDKIKSLTKGSRYVRNPDNVIYLDSAKNRELPMWITRGAPEKIHKIIVGFGIPQSVSEKKIGTEKSVRLQLMGEHGDDELFMVGVVKSEGELVHVFDIEALRIVLEFADTPFEFDDYLCWRENVVAEHNVFYVNGEEDLVTAWMLKRFQHKPLVNPEDFRDDRGRLPAVSYLGTYELFKRSPYFRWKQLADEHSGFWNALAQCVADGALSDQQVHSGQLAFWAGLLSFETKYLRAYMWHELQRKADGGTSVIDVLVMSSVLPDFVYYFSVHDASMSREDRTKNSAFMAHAIAGQRKCSCLAVGLLAEDPLKYPVMGLADPEGAPLLKRDMGDIAISINDALKWISDLARGS